MPLVIMGGNMSGGIGAGAGVGLARFGAQQNVPGRGAAAEGPAFCPEAAGAEMAEAASAAGAVDVTRDLRKFFMG